MAGRAGSSTGSVPLDGQWSVSDGSVVGYRVKEVLFGQDNTAVGRTSDVSGSITISGTNVVAGSFTVQMATVKSDFSQRDSQFRGRVMDVASYPTGTFVLSQPIHVGRPAASGVVKTMPVEGELTLRGQTRSGDLPGRGPPCRDHGPGPRLGTGPFQSLGDTQPQFWAS